MNNTDWFETEFPDFFQRSSEAPGQGQNLITVYIVLFILKEMRGQLGLEAMLEYGRKYMEKIEKMNPDLKGHLYKALVKVDVEKMYKEALS